MDECDFENGVENCFWEKLEWKSHFRPVSVWIVAGMKSLKISTRRLPVWRVVLSCGVRACGALFYRVSEGADFLCVVNVILLTYSKKKNCAIISICGDKTL